MKNVSFDIVIPSWNQKDLSTNCLLSIQKFSKQYDYRVIWVDNGSDEDVFQCMRSLLVSMSHVIIRNTKNLGFVKATNQGMQVADADFVVFMNNDTEAVPGWLGKLVAPMLADKKIALTGPRTTTKDSWQGNYNKKVKSTLILPESAMLAFFCAMLRKDVIQKVGYLDECFGVGFGDDDDYCYRIKQQGHKLALVADVVIPHHHRSTFNLLYSEVEIKCMQDTALELFFSKNKLRKSKRIIK